MGLNCPPTKWALSGCPHYVKNLPGGGSERKRRREDTNTGAKGNKVKDGRNEQPRRIMKRSL